MEVKNQEENRHYFKMIQYQNNLFPLQKSIRKYSIC